jgi:hypothetical protein
MYYVSMINVLLTLVRNKFEKKSRPTWFVRLVVMEKKQQLTHLQNLAKEDLSHIAPKHHSTTTITKIKQRKKSFKKSKPTT